jgi:uncharacterized protein YigA (DUF484 family)
MTQEHEGIPAEGATAGTTDDAAAADPAEKTAETAANTGTEPAQDGAAVTDDQVTDYLRRHPDFLALRPELFGVMTPPARWTGESVVDMQRFMVETLRGELNGLRDTAHDVIETSRSNMAFQSRTHDAVLALLAAANIPELVETVTDELPVLLDVDMAVIGFEPTASLALACSDVGRYDDGEVDRLIGVGRDVALIRAMVDDGTVFAGGAGLVRSAALARLRPEPPLPTGMLALGLRREGAFHPGQGTELLRFLARVVERCLRRRLDDRA